MRSSSARSPRSWPWSTAGRPRPTARAATAPGAGQLPDDFFRARSAEIDGLRGELPPPGAYAVGQSFCRATTNAARHWRSRLEREAPRRGPAGARLARRADRRASAAGERSRAVMPVDPPAVHRAPATDAGRRDAFERKLYLVRRRGRARRASMPRSASRASRRARSSTRACSPRPSSRASTPTCATARWRARFALVHSRFSTNTFPSWELAHPLPDDRPQRRDQHAARQRQLDARPRVARSRAARSATTCELLPLIAPTGASDSAGVRPRARAAGAWRPLAAPRGDDDDPEAVGGPRRPARRARATSTRYHARLMEPWDGPASLTFTDGRILGATLDRNGLRPGRWADHRRRLGRARPPRPALRRRRPSRSSAGGRLGPAGCSSSTSRAGGCVADGEAELRGRRRARPTARGTRDARSSRSTTCPSPPPRGRARSSRCANASSRSATRRRTCGCCSRRWPRRQGADRLDGQRRRPAGPLRQAAVAVRVLQAALRAGHEPGDRPGARAVRDEPTHAHRAGGQPARGDARARAPASMLEQPVLADYELDRLRAVTDDALASTTIDTTWPVDRGRGRARGRARARLRARPTTRSTDGATLLVLSDRRDRAPSACRSRRCSPLGRAPPPGADGHPPAGRPRGRVRRAARGAPRRRADRLRRERGQPVPDVRVARST